MINNKWKCDNLGHILHARKAFKEVEQWIDIEKLVHSSHLDIPHNCMSICTKTQATTWIYLTIVCLFVRDFHHQQWTTYGFGKTTSVVMHNL
jgi:hypothetical protein